MGSSNLCSIFSSSEAVVALNLKPKQSEPKEDETLERVHKVQKTSDSLISSMVKTVKEEKATEVVPSTSYNTNITDAPSTSSSTQNYEKMEEAIVTSNVETHSQNVAEVKAEPMVVEEPEEDVREIHIVGVWCLNVSYGKSKFSNLLFIHFKLGERNAVLFTLNAANSAKTADLPESFFDLSVQDIKVLLKDLRSEAHGTVDQPMLTAKLREMQEEQSQLTKLNRYKTVIIRIQFPNRYVLQGTFTPYETIEKVIDFVRPYLVNADINFHLCKYSIIS